MSDIQSDAAPSSTEPSAPVASVEEGKPIESGTPAELMPNADSLSSAQVAPAATSSETASGDASVVDSGNVAAAVEGGAPVTGVVAAVGGDAELAASHGEWTAFNDIFPPRVIATHPASALADQISEHVSALEGSGDTFVSRVASDVKRLVEQIKVVL